MRRPPIIIKFGRDSSTWQSQYYLELQVVPLFHTESPQLLPTAQISGALGHCS